MDNAQRKVLQMMCALKLPLPNLEKPGVENLNYTCLRELVKEEAQEFDQAMADLETARKNRPDGQLTPEVLAAWVQVIDAICDVIFVVHNTTNAMGLDLEPFFDEVLRSNLTKVGGPLSKTGKRLKPATYQSPRLLPILEQGIETYSLLPDLSHLFPRRMRAE